jgi:methionyl-tRNA formyltransferase
MDYARRRRVAGRVRAIGETGAMTQDRGLEDPASKASVKPDAVLLGDGPTALAALRSLAASCRVVRVLRAAADPDTDPVRALAGTAGIPVSALRALDELAQIVADLRPAAVVISSFNLILPPSILALSRFVNVHYSLLPQYRGRANVNWSIINGEPAAGISIHLVAPDLDSGNLLFQEAAPIRPDDTATSLYDRLNAIQERELGAAVVRAVAGDHGIPQPGQATYGCARVADDGEIDWGQPTNAIDCLIRALTPPFPGAFTHLETQRLVIVRAAPLFDPPVYTGRVPGRVVGRSRTEGWVDVLTGDGVLRVFDIVPASPSRSPSPAASLIRSTRATLGLSRLDLLRRITALEERLEGRKRQATDCR